MLPTTHLRPCCRKGGRQLKGERVRKHRQLISAFFDLPRQ